MSRSHGRIAGRWGALAAAALIGFQGMAAAQDFRGSIAGRVSDSSGGALPGVTVTGTNTATNTTTTAVTNEIGDYHLLYLTAGTYTVSAELNGFKKRTESNVAVRVGDRVDLAMKLDVGSQSESIEVVSEAPLLETGSASSGQVIDAERIALMPLSDGNPFVLARLAPGIVYTDSLQFARPFDNNASSGLRVDGGAGRNEFSLDGTPNTVNFGGSAELGRVAFVPPSDAVQEFKVETASFDAQHGHSGGGNLNVTIKSGANRFFGSAYEFYRDETLTEDTFFNKKLGREKAPKSYNRYGATLGGPIQRDKTFFFVAFEGLPDEFPEPTTLTVPTMAERNGDFSALLAQGIQLYDPQSARLEGTTVVRSPFPGNIIPANRISPAGRAILNMYPEPNLAGDAQGNDNYFTNNPRKDKFHSITARVDHNLSNKNKLFVRYARNRREETRNYFFPEVDGTLPIGTGLRRMNDNLAADLVSTLSSTTMLNVRTGWTRFREVNFRPHEGFNLSSLGFSANALGQFGDASYLPNIDLDSPYQDIGNALGANTVSDIYTVQSTLTRVMGAHSLRAGIDVRSYTLSAVNPNHQAGNYQFRGTFATARQGATTPTKGGDLVMLLLGIPTGGSIDRNGGRDNSLMYGGIFVQDDWRVTDKLTVNLGLRYDAETGMTEAQNRNVRGFDFTTTNPLEPSVKTAYAASPVPERPAAQFGVVGGYTFASASERNIWKADLNNIQPRLGFTYKLSEKMVIRGGGGVYSSPFAISNNNQTGFSQATNIPTTPDQGLTFPARMDNPFALGVQDSIGSSLGLVTNVGRTIDDIRPLERQNARAVRFLLGFQRELPGEVMFEMNYVGNRSSNVENATDININAVPRQYRSSSPLRDDATIKFLETDTFPNPFRNNALIPATENLRTAANLQRQRLLRPYPHFQDIQVRYSDGTTRYDALQMKLDKRFGSGFTLLTSYTLSKLTDKSTKLDPTDLEYVERPHPDDSRHRVTGSVIWSLPLGKDATGVARQLLDGWNLTSSLTVQTGRPIGDLAERYYGGNLDDIKATWDLDRYNPATTRVEGVFPTQDFYLSDRTTDADRRNDPRIRRSGVTNIRTFPQRLDSYRSQTRPILDASVVKQFPLKGRMKAQVRVEVFNVLNYVELNTPNFDPSSAQFGSSNSQENIPREVQLGLKLTF
jgi:hypothetical protein